MKANIKLEIEIPEIMENHIREVFEEIDNYMAYDGDFDSFMHDIVDLRILRHMQDNLDIMLDITRHFFELKQS